MPGSIEIKKNIHSARNLHKELQARGVRVGCLPISVLALGGQIPLRSVLDVQNEEMYKLSLVQRSQLEIRSFVEIDSQVGSDDVEAIFEFFFEQLSDGRQIAGLLIFNCFEASAEDNHYFVVLPRTHSNKKKENFWKKGSNIKLLIQEILNWLIELRLLSLQIILIKLLQLMVQQLYFKFLSNSLHVLY